MLLFWGGGCSTAEPTEESSGAQDPASNTSVGSGTSGLAGSGSSASKAGSTAQAPSSAGSRALTAGRAGTSPSAGSAGTGGAGAGGQDAPAAAGTSGAAAGSGGIAGATTTQAGAGAGAAGATSANMDHYQARGVYEVERLDNQGAGTLTGATDAQYPQDPRQDPSAFTVYLPKTAAEGERFPLITWGNGTFVNPTYYDELNIHLASHGFVVVGANDSQVGSGAAMLAAVDWATAQNTDTSSRLHGLLDLEHVGATGQSQGGAGTCNAGLDPRIDAIAPLSGVPLDGGANFVANLKAPAFFVNSAGEDASGTNVKDIYERVSAPAIYAVTKTGEHNSYGDIADDPMAGFGGPADDARESRAGITAWFDWQLKGKAEVRALFIGPDCGFCSGSTWKQIISKGF